MSNPKEEIAALKEAVEELRAQAKMWAENADRLDAQRNELKARAERAERDKAAAEKLADLGADTVVKLRARFDEMEEAYDRLVACLRVAGKLAFMRTAKPEDVAAALNRIMDASDAENASLRARLAAAEAVVEAAREHVAWCDRNAGYTASGRFVAELRAALAALDAAPGEPKASGPGIPDVLAVYGRSAVRRAPAQPAPPIDELWALVARLDAGLQQNGRPAFDADDRALVFNILSNGAAPALPAPPDEESR